MKTFEIVQKLELAVEATMEEFGVEGITSIQLNDITNSMVICIGKGKPVTHNRILERIRYFGETSYTASDSEGCGKLRSRIIDVNYTNKQGQKQPMYILDFDMAQAVLMFMSPQFALSISDAFTTLRKFVVKTLQVVPDIKELMPLDVQKAVIEMSRYAIRDNTKTGQNVLMREASKEKVERGKSPNLSDGEGVFINNNIFKLVYGISASDYKRRYNIDKPRDYIDNDGLNCISFLQSSMAALWKDYGWERRLELLQRLKESLYSYKNANKLPIASYLPIPEPKLRLTAKYERDMIKILGSSTSKD